MPVQFKFVELSIVTDETLETIVNAWVSKNWKLEGIRFVMTEHSKRPAMAFVSFIREMPQRIVDREPPRTPRPLVRRDVTTIAEDLKTIAAEEEPTAMRPASQPEIPRVPDPNGDEITTMHGMEVELD